MLHTLKKTALSFFAMSALCLAMTSQAQAVPTLVDLELQLLIDNSGSVDPTEFTLQNEGYALAFESAGVQDAIANGIIGSIAVQMIYWGGANQQSVVLDWTLIDSAGAADAFATAIRGEGKLFGEYAYTAPGSAINFSAPLFDNDFEGTRLVMDVSGDGSENVGDDTSDARDAALALHGGLLTINGLPIGNSGLATWYTNNVIGGPNSFVESASDFSAFDAAVENKLTKEISGGQVPEPSTMILLGTGLLGLFGYRMKKTV